MSSEYNVGVVTFITNSPYGSIHKFCPTEDYMHRLKNNKLKAYAQYDDGYRLSEKHEYNSNPYETLVYQDYFKTGYDLNIIGYINQESNIYLISKLLNYGLTFIVLNMTYAMQIESIISGIGKYLKIIQKNIPISSVALLLRYPETNKWCLLNNNQKMVIQSVKDHFSEIVDVLVYPFSYNANYEITYSTFVDIRSVIEKYYSDKSKFIHFDSNEQGAMEKILYGKILGNKTVYSENIIQNVCKELKVDHDNLLNKLIKCGILNHFPGKIINKYFFKNGYTEDRIIPVLLNLFNNTTYLKKTMEYNSPSRHFITPYLFRRSIPMKFKDRIPMSDRLILKILKNVKAGRTTLSGGKLYLRKYDIGEFSRNEKNNLSTRFIYN